MLIFFLIHVVWLCQVPGEEGVLATSSISAVLHLGVCEMWLFGVDVKGVTQWKTRPAHEVSFAVVGMGCGETGLGDEALVFDTWT